MKNDGYVLIGTRIELDREKVEREGKYDYNALIKRLDYIAEHFRLEVLESGHLYGNKKDIVMPYNNTGVAMMILYLSQSKWFAANVKSWEMAVSNEQGVLQYSKLV